MNQYPADVRDRLLRALDAGLARPEATRTFGVSDRTIRRWQQRRRETGSVVPTRRTGSPRRIAPAHEGALLAQVRAQPDATLAEHCATWDAAHGVRLSPATMSRALARLGWPRKKSP
jgi:transposase